MKAEMSPRLSRRTWWTVSPQRRKTSTEVLQMPQDPITRKDIRELIDCWEEEFKKITEGVRALEIGTHDVRTHMDVAMREHRACENAQVTTNKQMKSIQEALAHFMDSYGSARRAPVSIAVKSCAPTMDTPIRTCVQPRAPKMSTPITPPGAPPRFRSEFSLSPVNQATPAETLRVDRGRDLNERPTHESGNGIGGDTQQTINNAATNAGRPERKWYAWWHL